MASTQSKIFNLLLRLIDKKKTLSGKFTAGKLNYFDCPVPPASLQKHCRIDRYLVDNRNVFILKPLVNESDGKHILYLHGGAYIHNFITFHWKFLEELIKNTNCTITAPDYPLAPENTYKEAIGMIEQLYKQLLADIGAENLILMGDSAGGGLALALAQKLRKDQVSQPGNIILLSPLLDITLSNPSIGKINGLDPLIGIEGLREIGKKYAGNLSPDHYLVSPVNGSLKGLGKISLFTGSNDILSADAAKLKSLAEKMGIKLNYFEYPDMFHAWMLLNLPESKQARRQIIELINPSSSTAKASP